jgi:hypothetical protein
MTSTPTTHRVTTAALLLGGVVAANAAFIGLGATFDYPDILQQPAAHILERFEQTRSSTMAWFGLLAAGAALFGPAAVLTARLGTGRAARWSARAGVAAAAVQVIGLSRWFLLVPGYAEHATDPAASPVDRARAVADFETAHRLLGTVVGETLGYTLTALWTVLVLYAIGPTLSSRWLGPWSGLSAALILTGILVPLDLPGADLANFVGYLLWSLWLVALSIKLLRQQARAADALTDHREPAPRRVLDMAH